MRPPDGSGCLKGDVWKLKQYVYGLPQSGKNCNTLITSIFLSDKFVLHLMLTDTCLFVRRKEDGKIILLCLYVDDIYCATATVQMQEDLIAALKSFVGWQGLRIFLALTTLLDLKPLQIDVDLAYLYANLEEPVYMRPPDGSGCPEGKVWKLKNLCMASRNPERTGILS